MKTRLTVLGMAVLAALTLVGGETNALTVAAWVRPDLKSRVAGVASSVVACGDGGWNSGLALDLMARPGGGYAASCRLAGRLSDGRLTRTRVTDSGSSVRPGHWTHLTFTWDGRELALFVDGKEVRRGSHGHGYVPSPDGKVAAAVEQDARVVGVEVLSRVLTAGEIADVQARSKPTLPESDGLVSLLGAAKNGRRTSARRLLAAAEGVELAAGSKAEAELTAALAVGWIDDGDLKAASEARQKYLAHLRKRGAFAWEVNDFELRFSDALVRAGFAADAIAGLPPRATLTAELPRPVGFVATPQPGAVVSRTMPATAFYVAPDGDDAADGSKARPFRTLPRARDAVRALKAKGLPKDGVAVKLRGGTYPVTATLQLDAQDSGTADAPVVWCAEDGERAVLTGLWRVPAFGTPAADDPVLARVPAAACAQVRVADVKGFPHWNAKVPLYRAGGKPQLKITELYRNGVRLTPAQSPNEGWHRIVSDAGETFVGYRGRTYGRRLFRSDLTADELAAWAKEPEAMVTGYWTAFWSDQTLYVQKIDPASGVIDIGPNTFLKDRLFFLHNAPPALDAPGEWYLDRASGRLYVIPPVAGGDYALSSCDVPFVSAKGVSCLRLEGLVFEGGRTDAVELPGCTNVVFSGNVVRNFGGWALRAPQCANLSVEGNVLRTFGCGGISTTGGDRKTLTPSGTRICDNDVSDIECRCRTYCPALQLEGCGAEVSGNEFHHTPSSAIRLEGNDFFIVSNFVHDAVLESDDQGAVDIYCNPSYAGNLFAWNVWKDCGGHPKGFPDGCARAAVRFDDFISNQTVWGNRFIRCGTASMGAVQSNGGWGNDVSHNVFVSCNRAYSGFPRALDVWTNAVRKQVAGMAFDAQKGVDITKPPYATKYPGIARLFEAPPPIRIVNNVLAAGTPFGQPSPLGLEAHGNRAVEGVVEPDGLRGEGSCRVPHEYEVGPRPTASVRRARANDADAHPRRLCVGGVELGFTVTLGYPDRTNSVTFSEGAMTSYAETREGGRVTAVWKGHLLCGPDFTVTGALVPRSDGGWDYSFSYAGNDSGLAVRKLVFPEVSAAYHRDSSVLVPYSYGAVFHRPGDAYREGDYMVTWPDLGGNFRSFRFGAVLNRDVPSVYLDWKTPGIDAAFPRCRKDRAGRVRLGVYYDVPMTDDYRRTARRPFAGIVREYAGGWYEAAEYYRPYARMLPLFERLRARKADRATTARLIGLWLWNRGGADVVVPPALRFADLAGVPIALDWYWWHDIPYDTHYPNFWPPRDGVEKFAAAIARLQKRGIYTQIYMNGLSRAADDASWADGGEAEALWREPGKGPTRCYYNPYDNCPLVDTCGEAPRYHDLMSEQVRHAVKEGGLKAIYLDQIGCNSHQACYNPRHRHAPGDSCGPLAESRAFVERLRRENPGVQFSTEDTGEEMMDLFDTMITCTPSIERTWGNLFEPVAALQAIWGDVVTLFGSYGIIDGVTPFDPRWPQDRRLKKELDWHAMFPDQFAYELAHTLVYGVQPCVHNFRDECLDNPELAEDLRFMVEVARFRHRHADVFGDFLAAHPGEMTCARRTVKFCSRGIYSAAWYGEMFLDGYPAVLHSTWRHPGTGAVRTVLVNWTRERQACRLVSPDATFGGTLAPREIRMVDVR